MSKLSNVVMKEGRMEGLLNIGLKTLGDSVLLNVLRSEIKHEMETSSTAYQGDNGGSLGDFKLDWDSKLSQDILLRRKCESGEEAVVSALLDPRPFLENEEYLPKNVMMKVCVKKPGLSSILQFDCQATSHGLGKSGYEIRSAYCIQSTLKLHDFYEGYSFRHLNIKLRDELRKYLEARGIGESLTNFLLIHLHKKEQDQYVEWLHKLEAILA